MNITYDINQNAFIHTIAGRFIEAYTRFPEDWNILTISKDKFWDIPHRALQSKLGKGTDKSVKQFVKMMPQQRWRTCDTLRFESTLACGSLTVTGYAGDIPIIRHIFK
jgi:hypothetical protein